jgi:hypothetical protein
MEKKYPTHWGTKEELRFLDRIRAGRSFVVRRRGKLTEFLIAKILRGYVLAVNRRVNWGSIDRPTIEKWLMRNGYKV